MPRTPEEIATSKANKKLYMKEWRKQNRSRIREKDRDYFRNYMKSYRRENSDEYYGNCGVGRKFEKIALQFLPSSVDCNVSNFHGKWDIEWQGLKIDVKARKSNTWNKGFSFVDNNYECDYILAFCLNDNNEIIKIAFVPRKAFNRIFYISIDETKKTKYSKYIIKSFNELLSNK